MATGDQTPTQDHPSPQNEPGARPDVAPEPNAGQTTTPTPTAEVDQNTPDDAPGDAAQGVDDKSIEVGATGARGHFSG